MPVSSDREERARVKSRIGSLILLFFRQNRNLTFRMEDLRRYVELRMQGYIAPASTDRIVRHLRQRGELNYEVVSRHRSLYRILPVIRPAEQAELFAVRAS